MSASFLDKTNMHLTTTTLSTTTQQVPRTDIHTHKTRTSEFVATAINSNAARDKQENRFKWRWLSDGRVHNADLFR